MVTKDERETEVESLPEASQGPRKLGQCLNLKGALGLLHGTKSLECSSVLLSNLPKNRKCKGTVRSSPVHWDLPRVLPSDVSQMLWLSSSANLF